MGVQSRLFGTDGIRGRAHEEPLTPPTVTAFGRAVAVKFGRPGHPVVIGRDTRASGPILEDAVAAGVSSMGVDVLLVGVVPTPAIAFLTRHLHGCAGIVISASHNPFEDNGLKIFNADGLKCDDALELEIEALILDKTLRPSDLAGVKPGRIESWPSAATEYVELAVKAYGHDLDLRGIKVVVDAGHGAAYQTTPLVLRRLGAEALVLNDTPDGKNINAGCGSTHPDLMQKTVPDFQADIGLAHDGDADRLICCDETGSLLDGDEMLAIIGLDLLQRGKLAQKTMVATVMSNLGLDECFAAAGGKILRAAVGDRYVLEQMLTHNLNLGGEQSGHVILRDCNTTGDGLVTALQLLRIMKTSGQPLSRLRQCMKKYPQLLVNLKVHERIPLDELPEVMDTVKAVESELGTSGRVLLRYSGTEPKIRLLVETKDQALLQPVADRILAPIRKLLAP
ncbi:MAG: phosphoglucosamine mutase [Methylacidiphilales bacterium]|nr:phosphoglucosamine mutase [Candidatus Methylacidiphilales bacterium]